MREPIPDTRAWSRGGRLARRLAVLCAVVAAGSLAATAARGAPAQAGASARFLVSAQALETFVPDNLQPLLVQLRAGAAAAVAAHRTPLGKALALARIVHAAVAPTGASCWGYATVMVELARQLGLNARLTVGSSGFSDYDTHMTVSVWLPSYGHWGIVDPTFGGTFTRGSDPRPLGPAGLRDAVVHGWTSEIVWHSANASPLVRLSDYYVDPVFLFRYVGVYGSVGGALMPLVLPDSALLSSGVAIVSRQALSTTPPTASFPVTRATVDWTQARPATLALPPVYAPREVWHGNVQLPATVDAGYSGSVVVWVGAPGAQVGPYATAAVDGGSLSPILGTGGTIEIAGSGTAQVRVFAARRFPRSQER